MEIEGVEIRWRMGVYIWSRRSAFTPCHRPVRFCLVVRTHDLSRNRHHTPAAVCTSLESADYKTLPFDMIKNAVNESNFGLCKFVQY